ALVYLVIRIIKDTEFYIRNLLSKRYIGLFQDPGYTRILSLLDELDSIEWRKKELQDAPNKLCNQGCSVRERFLVKLYEDNSQMLSHIQTVLLIQLNDRLKILQRKYGKLYQRIQKQYHLSDDPVKWTAELKQYL
ncbi:MAG: hypothetical protein LUQ65_13785, partial [Candidatus Helarchaeota archaeon]|nr:hypothetical protein [Candidatus Helarchaeota archaeon]